MIKLVLFSDLIDDRNKELNDRLLNLFEQENPSIGYIPSCSDIERKYYRQTLEYYRRIGINNVNYFDLDVEYDERNFSDIFNYDAIHLSGGNTFYFLHLLKKRKVMDSIRNYVINGGILIGVSAGSILTTQTIESAGFGEDADPNNIELKDLKALGLVSFEFMPHWDGTEHTLEAIRKYARERNKIVCVVKDGGGVVVANSKVELIGETYIVNHD